MEVLNHEDSNIGLRSFKMAKAARKHSFKIWAVKSRKLWRHHCFPHGITGKVSEPFLEAEQPCEILLNPWHRQGVLKEASAPGLVQIEPVFCYSSKNYLAIRSVASTYCQMFLPKLAEIEHRLLYLLDNAIMWLLSMSCKWCHLPSLTSVSLTHWTNSTLLTVTILL